MSEETLARTIHVAADPDLVRSHAIANVCISTLSCSIDEICKILECDRKEFVIYGNIKPRQKDVLIGNAMGMILSFIRNKRKKEEVSQ